MKSRVGSWSSFVLLLVASPALAGPPQTLAAPESTPKIFGGEPTGVCDWPSTVSMGGNCSGTLVHPEIVIYAAHCGEMPWVWFGETLAATENGRFVDTEYCEINPDFGAIGTNTDFAFCKLVEPVTDVEIVPILMGCETALLEPGTEVVAVGFGVDEFDNYGTKRSVSFPIVAVDGEVLAGGDGFSICNGDSGGPLYLRLPPDLDPEQSWRVFGVTSWGPADCALAQYFGTMHVAVDWIEQTSGIDITPCHNADGSWQAGPDCAGFPLDPGAGNGAWADWCDAQVVGGPSASCGEPTVAEDLEAPVVAILEPVDQTVFDSDPETSLATIDIVAEASDPGWGLESVELLVNGAPIPNGAKSFPPWTWSGSFPPGGYVFEVVGTDLYGNTATSAPVHVGVDQEPPEPDPTGAETGETGEPGTDETAGVGPALDGEGGCACATDSSSGAPAGLGLLALLGLLGLRRRTEGR